MPYNRTGSQDPHSPDGVRDRLINKLHQLFTASQLLSIIQILMNKFFESKTNPENYKYDTIKKTETENDEFANFVCHMLMMFDNTYQKLSKDDIKKYTVESPAKFKSMFVKSEGKNKGKHKNSEKIFETIDVSKHFKGLNAFYQWMKHFVQGRLHDLEKSDIQILEEIYGETLPTFDYNIDNNFTNEEIEKIIEQVDNHIISGSKNNPSCIYSAGLVVPKVIKEICPNYQPGTSDKSGFGHFTAYHKNNPNQKIRVYQICSYTIGGIVEHKIKGKRYAYIIIKIKYQDGDQEIGHISIKKDDDNDWGSDYKQNKINCDKLSEDEISKSFTDKSKTFQTLILPDYIFTGKGKISCDWDSTLSKADFFANLSLEDIRKAISDPQYITEDNLTLFGKVIRELCEDETFRERIIINTSRRFNDKEKEGKACIKKIAEIMNLSEEQVKYETKKCNGDPNLKAAGKVKRAIQEGCVIHFDDESIVLQFMQQNDISGGLIYEGLPKIQDDENGSCLYNFSHNTKVICLQGPTGCGKSFLTKLLKQKIHEIYGEDKTVIVLGTDDGMPFLLGGTKKTPIDIVSSLLGKYDYIIFDSTGNGQRYPDDAFVIHINKLPEEQEIEIKTKKGMKKEKTNGSPDYWMRLFVKMLVGMGERGINHSNIIGCGITFEEFMQLLQHTKNPYIGTFNNLSLPDLFNQYPENFVIQFLKANSYTIKGFGDDNFQANVVSYQDGSQKFTSDWGQNYGRGAIIFRVQNEDKSWSDWMVLKRGLMASKDNGYESTYGSRNINQITFNKTCNNFNESASGTQFHDLVISTKKDGICINVSKVLDIAIPFLKKYFNDSGYTHELKFLEATGCIMTTNRSSGIFSNEIQTIEECLFEKYQNDNLDENMTAFIADINAFISDNNICEGSTIIFEFIAKTAREELACQGPACFTFLGVQQFDGVYVNSNKYDIDGYKIPFDIPFYWTNIDTVAKIKEFTEAFELVVSCQKSLEEFLEEFPPNNTPANNPGQTVGISYEGFVMTINGILYKLKSKVYYEIHKLHGKSDNITDIMEKIIKQYKTSEYWETWCLHFPNIKHILRNYEEYVKNMTLLRDNLLPDLKFLLDIFVGNTQKKKNMKNNIINKSMIEGINQLLLSKITKITSMINEEADKIKKNVISQKLNQIINNLNQINFLPNDNINAREYGKHIRNINKYLATGEVSDEDIGIWNGWFEQCRTHLENNMTVIMITLSYIEHIADNVIANFS